jgi:hypothetical protein
MTGTLPVGIDIPVAANYPRSLFTMLAGTHHLHVTETLTRVCPAASCRHRPLPATPDPDLVDDVRTVYLRTLLSDRVADDWGLPAINDRWAGFGVETPQVEVPSFDPDPGLDLDAQLEYLLYTDKVAELTAFLGELGTGPAPGLWFLHSLLPHQPFELLPSGQRYTGNLTGLVERYWVDDPNVVAVAAQRLVLQTMALDHLVGSLLDRLAETGLMDTAMLVVTADHGAVFRPGQDFRAFDPPWVTRANRDEILPVPLFVRYPGQRAGAVDHRDARNIDLLPTLADALRVRVPDGWELDGHSLLADPVPNRPHTYVADTDEPAQTFEGTVDARRFARSLREWLGPSGVAHEGFRLGPFGHLVGTGPETLPLEAPAGRVTIDQRSVYDDVDPTGPEVPALFEATVTGSERGAWLAVALNGTVAGIGPAYQAGENLKLVALVDPALLRPGLNDVAVYEVRGGGTSLRPLRVSR